jgi:anti-sigma B factor antagonist
MNEPKAVFEVLSQDAQLGIIEVHGELTGAAEARLMEANTQAISGGAHTVLLDFSNMAFMNSTGIGLLVTFLVRANRNGTHLAACGLNEHYREIFALTRLEEAFTIYGTRQEALDAALA